MLTLHYAPHTISLATLIVLEEPGVSYELKRVDFKANEQRSPEYLRINPLGRVPTLQTPDGSIT